MKRIHYRMDSFFIRMERQGLALGYNDVRLATNHSDVLPKNANLKTMFSRNVAMNIPIVSSPMDTVTEAQMAIAMAQLGGLGIIHKNLTPEVQASAVRKVKHRLSAFVREPVCIRADQTVREVMEFAKQKGFKFLSFPVKDKANRIVGVVTSSVFEFCLDTSRKITDVMQTRIISAPEGTGVPEAYQLLMKNRIKILPVFNGQKELVGIYTLADVKRILTGDSADYNLSGDGTLRVGAAIGVGEEARRRMELLARANVDVVVIDTAHGDSAGVLEMLRYCKKVYPGIDVVVGNVSEGSSAKRLVDAGADGIRVGQGPGSICTTRVVAGVGCPQVTAVYNCARAVRGSGIPVCADGGIELSGDITIALAIGGDTVMLGKGLAGTTESPGDVIIHAGQHVKVYRGMGSMAAMIANRPSRERYSQGDSNEEKLVPEGIESVVPYKGDVGPVVHQFLGGLRAGMGYCGAKDIKALQETATLWRVTPAGMAESRPHGLVMTKNPPNYQG